MTQFFARKLNKKGFTLAELLIVVAIIAVLVAIAVPIFNNSLIKTRYGVHYSNGRAMKSMAVAELLSSKEFDDLDLTAANSKFIAAGEYDFDKETFTLKCITVYSGSADVGMWATRSAITGSTEGKVVTGWAPGGNDFKFDGESKNMNEIGRWGTSKVVSYHIIFSGIEVADGIVKDRYTG